MRLLSDRIEGGGGVMSKEAAIKSGAERYAQYHGDVRRLLSSEYAADVRWLTASLFALNAGGLVSLASKDAVGLVQRLAGISFWAGIFLAFGLVFYSQRQTMRFLNIIQNIEECWVLAATTGQMDEERLTRLDAEKGQVSTHLSPYFSIGSFALFTIALCLMAWPQ